MGEDDEPEGFQWIDANDSWGNVLSFVRSDGHGSHVACIVNFSAMPHFDYRVGLPAAGTWHEVVNTDAEVYAGSGVGNMGGVTAETALARPARLGRRAGAAARGGLAAVRRF